MYKSITFMYKTFKKKKIILAFNNKIEQKMIKTYKYRKIISGYSNAHLIFANHSKVLHLMNNFY